MAAELIADWILKQDEFKGRIFTRTEVMECPHLRHYAGTYPKVLADQALRNLIKTSKIIKVSKDEFSIKETTI